MVFGKKVSKEVTEEVSKLRAFFKTLARHWEKDEHSRSQRTEADDQSAARGRLQKSLAE